MSDDNLTDSMPVARGSQNTHKPRRVPARILWPALGFPAVIDPSSSQATDATNSVCVLLLSKRDRITAAQAAAHLRVAPWNERHARSTTEGKKFDKEAIQVRSDSDRKFQDPLRGIVGLSRNIPPVDKHSIVFDFGYDLDPTNTPVWRRQGISAALSLFVVKFYADLGYRYLQEIRVSKDASSALGPGLYNIYWVNSNPNDTQKDISDEMSLLIEHRATPTREELLQPSQIQKGWESSFAARLADDKQRAEWKSFLLAEYEYEYGALHKPYSNSAQTKDPKYRTEVLHPLFVLKNPIESLRVGHVTDMHVDVRCDVYEDNLKKERIRIEREMAMDAAAAGRESNDIVYGDKDEIRRHHAKQKLQREVYKANLNNWNKSCITLYKQAQQKCDVLLLTGDLVDYGRGHVGIAYGDELGTDAMYHVDRNWFLFYYLIASGDAYQKPAYTILGNHDWRINPYPPLAVAGAPNPRELIHDYMQFRGPKTSQKEWNQKLQEILKMAHGPGHEKKFSYSLDATGLLELQNENVEEFNRALWKLVKQTKTMDIKGAATETTVESVAWYLLLINPFLNYSFRLPGGHDVLMLDWGEDEDVLGPLVVDGEEWYYLPTEAGAAALGGPRARNSLTDVQKLMVEEFVAKPGSAKVLGIHAPPIGPHAWWTDDKLEAGVMRHEKKQRVPGSTQLETTYSDGRKETWYGHPLFAVSPKDGKAGQQADCGTFQRHREWFIKELRKPKANVRLVLSGHIHRNGLFVVRQGSGGEESYTGGALLIRSVQPNMAPRAAYTAPLYVNTTSAGPRGHFYPLFRSSRMDAYEDPGYAEMDLDGSGKMMRIQLLETYIDPGYAEIELGSDGTIKAVEFHKLD